MEVRDGVRMGVWWVDGCLGLTGGGGSGWEGWGQ